MAQETSKNSKRTCVKCGEEFRVIRDYPGRDRCRTCVKREVDRRSWHKNKNNWIKSAAAHRCIITKPCCVCRKEVSKEVPDSQVYNGVYTGLVLCSDECRKIRNRELKRIRQARWRAK